MTFVAWMPMGPTPERLLPGEDTRVVVVRGRPGVENTDPYFTEYVAVSKPPTYLDDYPAG